jgi:hypothetical protein
MAKGLIGLAMLACIAGCSRQERSSERFVSFYADVVRAQLMVLDSTAAAESAMVVARRHGMSRGELAAFRSGMAAQPEKWIRIWDRVLDRLQETEVAPSRGPG